MPPRASDVSAGVAVDRIQVSAIRREMIAAVAWTAVVGVACVVRASGGISAIGASLVGLVVAVYTRRDVVARFSELGPPPGAATIEPWRSTVARVGIAFSPPICLALLFAYMGSEVAAGAAGYVYGVSALRLRLLTRLMRLENGTGGARLVRRTCTRRPSRMNDDLYLLPL